MGRTTVKRSGGPRADGVEERETRATGRSRTSGAEQPGADDKQPRKKTLTRVSTPYLALHATRGNVYPAKTCQMRQVVAFLNRAFSEAQSMIRLETSRPDLGLPLRPRQALLQLRP